MHSASKSTPNTPPASRESASVPFAVPFAHRLLFTSDVFGADRCELAAVLEMSNDLAPKVQFWIDQQVLSVCPHLTSRITEFFEWCGDRVRPAGVHAIVGGEAVKNDWSQVERVLAAINDSDLDRRSYLVVIGGGAVLDAVGFAAATAHRGVRLIRLPTTTLAQADSGVGVKNAVNRFGKKNWLGVFAVPWAVINDTALLASLPDRDFAAGFSEAVKVALLKSPREFERLCETAAGISARDMRAVLPAIRTSAELHRAHITSGGDPFEALEARPLDYGHWSAHRLEAVTNFAIRHGEAVAIGVAVDTVYSSLVCGLPEADAGRVLHALQTLGLPLMHPAMSDTHALFKGLEEFRQHLGGRLTLTMLRGIGDPIEVHEVDREAMVRAIGHVAAVERGNAFCITERCGTAGA
jgi:3-dehydroquinate synthase